MLNLICALFSEFRVLYIGWKQEIESLNVLIRYRDLTRGEPDLKVEQKKNEGDYQHNRSLEISTSIVVSKRKES